MLATLYQLGITPSNSRPSVSNDNPYAESLFKTLKYRPEYHPKGFATLLEAREWVSLFVQWYNYEHHHSGLKFLTPDQRVNRRKSLKSGIRFMKLQKINTKSVGADVQRATGACPT